MSSIKYTMAIFFLFIKRSHCSFLPTGYFCGMKRMDWFPVGRDLFKGGRTGFGWFQGGKDWFWLVSGWEGLVSARSAF